jgi:hypothetical protein
MASIGSDNAMTRWEYQVIHLNVEGATPLAAPTASDQANAPAAKGGAGQPNPAQMFSKEYLQKEFPGFYTPNPTSQQSPAQQLQTFLNGVGQQGWSLIGVFPLGHLLMMIFRRRLAAEAAGDQTAAAPAETGSPQPPAPASPIPDLQALLQRIEALEQRLDPPDQA